MPTNNEPAQFPDPWDKCPRCETPRPPRAGLTRYGLCEDCSALQTQRWWLSFAGEGDHFLGACIVEAPDEIFAGLEAHRHGCHLGSQVLSVPMPEGPECEEQIGAFGMNVAITPAQIHAQGMEFVHPDGSPAEPE